MGVVILIIGLILFISLVVVHEYGHFLMARRNGVKVEEFAIGFPPKLWSRRMPSGFRFSINWLPLGGFVRLKGEHDADKTPGSFGAASLGVKVKVMLAGVIMNVLAAWLILTVVALLGMPKLLDNQFSVNKDTKIVKNQVLVGYVEPNSPASKVGLQVRDQLLSISNNQTTSPVTTENDFPKLTESYAGQKVTLSIKRGKQVEQLSTTFRDRAEVQASKKTDNPKGYLGVSPTEYTVRRSTWSAPITSAGVLEQFTVATFKGLGSAIGNLFHGHAAQASEQVSGPVGIFVILKDGSLLGYQFMLMIIAIISLTLAIMNVMPIPALDGGRLFVMLLYRVIRRPLTRRAEELIHGTGFALLMALFVLITIVDVKRFL